MVLEWSVQSCGYPNYIWISLQLYCLHIHLKWQLIGRLGDVSLNDVGSCDGWDIDGGLFVHQQTIPFVVNLKKNRMCQLTENVEVNLAVVFKALYVKGNKSLSFS